VPTSWHASKRQRVGRRVLLARVTEAHNIERMLRAVGESAARKSKPIPLEQQPAGDIASQLRISGHPLPGQFTDDLIDSKAKLRRPRRLLPAASRATSPPHQPRNPPTKHIQLFERSLRRLIREVPPSHRNPDTRLRFIQRAKGRFEPAIELMARRN
jgi:hypothetical protein